jgi:hypothetical protein
MHGMLSWLLLYTSTLAKEILCDNNHMRISVGTMAAANRSSSAALLIAKAEVLEALLLAGEAAEWGREHRGQLAAVQDDIGRRRRACLRDILLVILHHAKTGDGRRRWFSR